MWWTRLNTSLGFRGDWPYPHSCTSDLQTPSALGHFSATIPCVQRPSNPHPLCGKHLTVSYHLRALPSSSSGPSLGVSIPSAPRPGDKCPYPVSAPSNPLSTWPSSPLPLSLTPGLHWLLLCYDCHRPSSLGYLPQLRAVIIHPGFESEGPGVQVQILTLGKSFTLLDLISVPSTVSWGKATEPPPQAGTQQTPLGCPLQSHPGH